MISVLIVEDQAILRESLARSIADQPDMTWRPLSQTPLVLLTSCASSIPI